MGRISRFLVVGATVALLAACGSRGPLVPPEGEVLPPATFGSTERPTAEELIEPGPQMRPDRSDELLRRSEKRQDDRFDLPPTG